MSNFEIWSRGNNWQLKSKSCEGLSSCFSPYPRSNTTLFHSRVRTLDLASYRMLERDLPHDLAKQVSLWHNEAYSSTTFSFFPCHRSSVSGRVGITLRLGTPLPRPEVGTAEYLSSTAVPCRAVSASQSRRGYAFSSRISARIGEPSGRYPSLPPPSSRTRRST